MLTLARGRDFKDHLRAAAALAGLHDDKAIAEALGVSRNTVGDWWTGAQPSPRNLRRFADVTGQPVEDLRRYVYDGGPAPILDWPTTPEPAPPVPLSARQRAEAQRWQDQRAERAGSDDSPPQPPTRRPATEG